MAALLQRLTDLGIGQARMGVDYCLEEAETGQLAGAAEFHFADHGQAIHVRLQRAQPVGQGLGQHGHNLFREVHRIAAHRSFFVQG